MEGVRHSEFWQAMDEVFGADYARSLAADLTMGALGGRTALEALDAGIAPRQVWQSLCDAMEVPDQRRWAHRDPKRRPR
jgi:hypothetical protein